MNRARLNLRLQPGVKLKPGVSLKKTLEDYSPAPYKPYTAPQRKIAMATKLKRG